MRLLGAEKVNGMHALWGVLTSASNVARGPCWQHGRAAGRQQGLATLQWRLCRAACCQLPTRMLPSGQQYCSL